MAQVDRIFIGFMVVVGLAIGALLIAKPEWREFRIAPLFWALIPMALLELLLLRRGHGAPGTMIRMESRLIGFFLAVGLMFVVPFAAGSPGRLF